MSNSTGNVNSRVLLTCYPQRSLVSSSMSLPFGNTGSLGPACAPDRSIDLTVSHTYCPCTLMKFFITSRVSIPVKCSIGDLRYIVGGDRPSQTSHQPLYLYISNYPLSKVPNLVNVSLSRNLGSRLKNIWNTCAKNKEIKVFNTSSSLYVVIVKLPWLSN